MISTPRGTSRWWWLALSGAFVFRLLFGLSSDFFFEDQTQIFLLGLRYYATGHWPYFGPDVVWTKSEIPGALQALLVGVPLKVVPLPEAPFVLLNLLSMGALIAFAWYVSARFPTAPRCLVYGWLPCVRGTRGRVGDGHSVNHRPPADMLPIVKRRRARRRFMFDPRLPSQPPFGTCPPNRIRLLRKYRRLASG